MEIVFNKHSYSKYIEQQMLTHVKKLIPEVLGKRVEIITTMYVKLQCNFQGFHWDDFNKMFDHGKATLTIFPNWMNEGRHTRLYAIKHELIHLRDVMDGKLEAFPPDPGKKIKIKWKPTINSVGKFYNKIVPDWIVDELYDNSSRSEFAKSMGIFYPWEEEGFK
jgi:hypothetical protein